MRDIRKLSIGPDYETAFHYTVSQDVINGTHKVTGIKAEHDGSHTIFVENAENEIYAWKTISASVPVVVEYNIEF